VCDGKLYITIIKAVLKSLDYYLLKSEVSETRRIKVGVKSCTQNIHLLRSLCDRASLIQ